MARQTVVTELSLLMIRIGRAVEGRSVAIPARVWQIRILIVRMTLIAGQRLVCTHERERGVAVTEC